MAKKPRRIKEHSQMAPYPEELIKSFIFWYVAIAALVVGVVGLRNFRPVADEIIELLTSVPDPTIPNTRSDTELLQGLYQEIWDARQDPELNGTNTIAACEQQADLVWSGMWPKCEMLFSDRRCSICNGDGTEFKHNQCIRCAGSGRETYFPIDETEGAPARKTRCLICEGRGTVDGKKDCPFCSGAGCLASNGKCPKCNDIARFRENCLVCQEKGTYTARTLATLFKRAEHYEYTYEVNGVTYRHLEKISPADWPKREMPRGKRDWKFTMANNRNDVPPSWRLAYDDMIAGEQPSFFGSNRVQRQMEWAKVGDEENSNPDENRPRSVSESIARPQKNDDKSYQEDPFNALDRPFRRQNK